MKLQALVEAVINDPERNRRGKYYSIRFGLEMDHGRFLLDVDNGSPIAVTENAADAAASGIAGSSETWRRFFEPAGNGIPLVCLLSGEYDYSAPPEAAREIAQRTGCHLEVMKGLGHFPMSEDPGRFKEYLAPVLTHIVRGSSPP